MNIKTFYDELKLMEVSLKGRELSEARVEAHFNWFGDEVHIAINAYDGRTYDKKWELRDGICRGKIENVEDVLMSAKKKVAAVPSKDERQLQMMIQQLSKLAATAESASAEGSFEMREAWDLYAKYLRKQADYISKNGLPNPNKGMLEG